MATNTLRTTRTESGGRHGWWRWWWCVCWMWCCTRGGMGVEGQGTGGGCQCDYDGDDVAVAAVVSVFVTLLVVAIALLIVYIILRRRNPGFPFSPKQTRKSLVNSEEADVGKRFNAPRDSCFENHAFAGRDTVDLDGGTEPRMSISVGRKETHKKRKTSTVSFKDVPGSPHTRKGSLNKCLDPETVSVWLQSQDIIGLGFNISGNMSDGIYISQVHNRGPAMESGKMHVGDRICSVTIMYDKIVFEDALTILSYASPYPVQVTLQKESSADSTNPSGSSEQLNHPLYRSQSFDGIPQYREFHHFRKPKRWLSEIKPNGRLDSPKRDTQGDIDRRNFLSKSVRPMGWDAPVRDILAQRPRSTQLVEVHATEKAGGGRDLASCPLPREKMERTKKGDFEGTPSKSAESPQFTKKKGRLDRELAFDFANLKDQLLGSESVDDDDDDIFSAQVAAVVDSSPKSPPSKPERKKKTSSASITSNDNPLELGNGLAHLEAMCVAVKTVTVHALPPGTQDLGPEVEEEEIQPAYVKREVVINAEGFDFAPVEKAEPPTEGAEERPKSPVRFVYVKRPSRPASPEGEPVEEEVFEASVASRNTQAGPFPRSENGQHANSYGETKDEKQAQSKFVLDDEDLERLLLKNPSETAARGLDGGDIGSDLKAFGSGIVLQNDTRHPSEDETPRPSGDFITIDMSDRSGPSERMVFGSSRSDNHLEQRSGDSTENKKNRDISLDWSGQRLVRSGSFSVIPQDDSDSDWVDRNTRNDDDDDDDDTSTTSAKRSAVLANVDSDQDVSVDGVLSFNFSNLSDVSDSVPSGRSSFPVLTNGPVVSEVVLPPPPGSHNAVVGKSATIELTPTSDSNTLNPYSADDEQDC